MNWWKLSRLLTKFTAMIRTVLFCFLLLVSGMAADAQRSKQYSFRHFSVNNGLASNTVNDVIQDPEGYMWFATTNGLQRYDGSSFLIFKSHTGDPTSIPNTNISNFFLDRKGRLWLTYDNNHFGIFDTRKFVYKKANIEWDPANVLLSQHLVQLNDGQVVLIKSGRSMYRYDEPRNTFVRDDNVLPHPNGWHVSGMSWDEERKTYWITCDSGLLRYDPATHHQSYRDHNTDNDPVIAAFAGQRAPVLVNTDAEGNVYYFYWKPDEVHGYIFRFNRKKNIPEKTFIDNIGYHELWAFLKQRNGRMWVYGAPFFAEWNSDNTFSLLPNEYKGEQSPKFNHATHGYEDRENNIWIATDNGAYEFNPDAQIFSSYAIVRPGEQIVDGEVNAVTEVPDGRKFVGCWGVGLYAYDKNFNPIPVPASFKDRYKYMSVWDMTYHAPTGKLWIAQQGGVLDIYDPKTDAHLTMQPDIFQHSTIRQVDDDTSGNLWFGTQNGMLIKWDLKRSGGDVHKGYELVYQTVGRIYKVHYDYAGYIWISSLGGGLVKIDAKTNKVAHIFTTKGPPGERIFSDAPYDMTYLNDTTLLVAAQCINIVNTRTNQVRFFTADDGLPSNTVISLQRDRNGIVWAGLIDGLCRIDMKKKLISYFDRRDGIPYDKFAETGVEQLKDGRMAFLTDHNFLVFDPQRIAGKNQPPEPAITAFRVAGVPLSIDSLQSGRSVALNYNNTSIAINFSALSFLQQQKVHYYYMLEGIDKDWIHTDHPVEAIYNYLPPGEYTFKVKSETVDGLTSEKVASIPIVVRAPFWKSWWFYSLLALLALSILYLVDRERMNKTRSLQQMRRQIRENLRNEVSNTLNNINVLSEIAKIKADKNVEQSKDFIDQISEKSRNMIEVMDDMLWSIDPQNDSMKKNLLRIKEVTEGMRISHDTNIDLIVDHKVQDLELDMRLRYELFFFYKEAMHFIFQHLDCEQVFVNFNKVRSKLMVEMLCECRDAPALKEAFVKSMEKRVTAMAGMMEVISESRSFAAVLYVEIDK